jgi:hypothetical protein
MLAAGNPAGAMKTFELLGQEGDHCVDLTEAEYKFLLYVLAESGDFEALRRIWSHMGDNLGALGPVSEGLISKYFSEQAGRKSACPSWRMSTVHVHPRVCGSCQVFGIHTHVVNDSSCSWTACDNG